MSAGAERGAEWADRMAAAPANADAEIAVIGAIFLRPDAYDQIDWLPSSDFYTERHRLIYHAIRSMMEEGVPVDVLLVADRLRSRDELDRVGGMAYLGEIAVNTASYANIKRYAEIVKSTALLRRLQALASDLREQAHEPGAVAGDIADAAESRLNDIRHGRDDSEAVPFHASLDAALLARNGTASES